MELKTSPTGMGAIMSGVVPGSQLDRAGVVRPGHVLVSVAGAADVAPPPTSSGAHFGCSLWLCGCVAVCLGCLGVCVCAFLAIVLPCQARTSAEWCSMTSRHSSSACWHVPCAWGSPTLTPSLHILPRYVVTPCPVGCHWTSRRLSCLVACWCNPRMVLPQAHNAAAPATSATTHSHHQLAGAGRSLMHSALSTWHRGARVLYCSSLTVVRPALVPPRCLLSAQTDYRCVCSRACCGECAMAVVSQLLCRSPTGRGASTRVVGVSTSRTTSRTQRSGSARRSASWAISASGMSGRLGCCSVTSESRVLVVREHSTTVLQTHAHHMRHDQLKSERWHRLLPPCIRIYRKQQRHCRKGGRQRSDQKERCRRDCANQ